MRRLLICTPSHAARGGVETIINDLCRELPSRGWDVVLGLARGARFNDVERYRTAQPDLPIIEMDGRGGTHRARLEAVARTLRSTRPDVVLSARLFDAYRAVAEAKRGRGAPRLAIAVRAFEPEYIDDARRYRDVIDLCAADGVLLSNACVAMAGIPRERVANLPGGVRSPTASRVKREAGSELRIGYIGRIEQEQKRVFDLVPFMAGLDAAGVLYHLDVIGGGSEEQALRARLQPWLNAGRVSLTGWVNHEELYADHLPRLDCFVHFADTEGVTIAPREAMVHGVVPVISEFRGMRAERQFVHDVNALTFPVGAIEQAVANVVRLAREPELLARLSTAAACSQYGAYTFSGSMDAWAKALDASLERAPAIGPVPAATESDSGRLSRIGLNPWLAQRVRNLLRVTPRYADAGSEWPTRSGLMTNREEAEILRFARDNDGPESA